MRTRSSLSAAASAALCMLAAVSLCAVVPALVRAQSTGSIRLALIEDDSPPAPPRYFAGGGGQVATYSRGLLQFWYNGAWGTVCDDYFGNVDAAVACRQLGWQSRNGPTGRGYSPTWFTPATYGTGAIVLDDVQCTGSESTLMSCSHSSLGYNNCGHHEDVAIDCFTFTGSSGLSTAVYLVALTNDSSAVVHFEGDETYPASDSRGLLYFRDGTTNGTVCDDSFDLNDRGPQVVCRQMGWNLRSGPAGTIYSPHNIQPLPSQVPASSVPIMLDDVVCTGSEASIWDCAHDAVEHNCGHSEDVAVDCFIRDPSIPAFALFLSFPLPVSTSPRIGGDSIALTLTTGVEHPIADLTIHVTCTIPDAPSTGMFATVGAGNSSVAVTFHSATTTVLQRVTCTPSYLSGDTRFVTAQFTGLSFDLHPGTQFQQASSALPAARSGGAATVLNGKIVVMGGETDSGIDGLCHVSYDGVSFVQSGIILPPVSRTQGALVTVGTGVGARLLLLTGRPTSSVGNDVWMSSDASEQDWFRAGFFPSYSYTGRSGAGVVAIGSTLIVMGGYHDSGSYLNDIYLADVSVEEETVTWTTSFTAPWSPRAGFAAVAFRDQLYVIGGTSYGSTLNDVWLVSASSVGTASSWSLQSPMSCSPRSYFSYGVAGNGLAIVGGYGSLVQPLGDMCTFDAPLWHAPRSAPFARAVATGRMPNVNNSLLLIGGLNGSSLRTSDTWLMKLDSTTFAPATIVEEGGSGMASGTLIAIVAGCIVGGLLLFILVIFVCCKQDRQKQTRVQPHAETRVAVQFHTQPPQTQPQYAQSVQLAVVEDAPVSPPGGVAPMNQNYVSSPPPPPPPPQMPLQPMQPAVYGAAAVGGVVAGSMVAGSMVAGSMAAGFSGWQSRAGALRNRIHTELFSTLDSLAAFNISPAQSQRAQQIAAEVHALVGELLAMQPRLTGLAFSASAPVGSYDVVSVAPNTSPCYLSSVCAPAPLSSLSVGDRLVSVESVSVECAEHAAFLLQQSLIVLPGQSATLLLYRGAHSMQISIDVGAAGQQTADLAFKHQRIQHNVQQAKQLLQECSQQGLAQR